MKSQVKQIALINGLEKIARKKESMGICFIGNRNFKDFIREVCIRVVFQVL
jgi:tRNA U34 2-thiouridine synthase MnmA/TrmU